MDWAAGSTSAMPSSACGQRRSLRDHDDTPETGAPDLDTLRVLGAYRGDLETSEPLPFGVWGEILEPGRVRLGDTVEPE